MLASVLGSLYMLAYNEGGGARSHWWVRNAQNAVGHTAAAAGAMLVSCTCSSGFCLYRSNGPSLGFSPRASTGQRESDVDAIGYIAIALSVGIILTTIHTQDYKDVLGDVAAGRVTLPIAYPFLSRVATAFVLLAWSWGMALTWRLDSASAAAMGVLSLVVGVSFVTRRGTRADVVSSYLYNVSQKSPSMLEKLSSHEHGLC
jgi:hypothetical protein